MVGYNLQPEGHVNEAQVWGQCIV